MTGLEAQLDDALPRGYVAAFRLLRDGDAAREACQEAAAKALEHRDRFDPSRPFYPWFYRILRNHCLDLLARRKREKPPIEAEVIEEQSNGGLSAEAELISDEGTRALMSAIETLDGDLREIIELRHFQDMTYEEIAETLQVPQGTVMSRLYRARSRLREALSGEKRRSR